MAMIIMIIGFIMIWSFYISGTGREQPHFYAEDALSFMSSNTISSVSGTIPYFRALLKDGNITNPDFTIIEQITLMYMNGDGNGNEYLREISKNMTWHIINSTIPHQYGAQVLLNHTMLYNQSSSAGIGQKDADTLVSAKKVVVVVFNKVNISDPYMMEVRVWR